MSTPVRTLKRGDSWRDPCTVKAAGLPADLTGVLIRAQLRDPETEEVVLELSEATGYLIVTDAGAGTFLIDVPASVTNTLSLTSYLADIEFTFADGFVRSSPTFKVKFTRDITRPVATP